MKLVQFAGTAAVVSSIAFFTAGCGGAVAEMAEEAVAEAVANQAISAYYEASLTVTTAEGDSITLSCGRGGEINWEQMDSSGEVFFVSSRGCTVDGPNGAVTLEGDYTITGLPPQVNSEGQITDLDGKTIQVDGSIVATTEDGTSRSCDYELDMSVSNVMDTDGSVTLDAAISGSMCDRRGFDVDTSLTISGQVEVTTDAG